MRPAGGCDLTAKDFRKIALSLPEAEERAHMSHPDFRVAGKIFATLGYPDKTRGMVKLSPEEQHYFSKNYPDVFVPVKGVWGKRGATNVYLKAASKEVLAKAIQAVGACPGSGRTFLQQFGWGTSAGGSGRDDAESRVCERFPS